MDEHKFLVAELISEISTLCAQLCEHQDLLAIATGHQDEDRMSVSSPPRTTSGSYQICITVGEASAKSAEV